MCDDFLLTNETARKLYSRVKGLPIFDYHCHLNPAEILNDRAFYNLTELWLECDHYKWRVMRNAGVDEKFITGNASPYEKFYAFASVLPEFIGNPVYHWAHLELKKYFGIVKPLCADTALEIWEETLERMSGGSFSARKLIEISDVDTVITTDDPLDDLDNHKKLRAEKSNFKVLPCFRPDPVINIEKDGFADYIRALSGKTSVDICDTDALMAAVGDRLDYFVENGAVAADCSFGDFEGLNGVKTLADSALKKRISGENLTDEERGEYKFCILKNLARAFAQRGMVMQIHTGVVRNRNSMRYSALGADCGIDSVGNAVDIEAAGRLFDAVEKEGGMPRTIVYTLNPSAYYPLATMLGNFAGQTRGKTQLGAAWWFMDHRDGIREQLKIFAATSGLGYFNGMLTDSRSFVSYARHDYFRRVLCSVLGEWAEAGEYPSDTDTLATLAENICYYNAKNYFTLKR